MTLHNQRLLNILRAALRGREAAQLGAQRVELLRSYGVIGGKKTK